MPGEAQRLRAALSAAYNNNPAQTTVNVNPDNVNVKLYDLTSQIDGVTATFTFSPTPSALSPIEIIHDGLTLREGAANDYTLSGVTSITLTYIPVVGSSMQARYAEQS